MPVYNEAGCIRNVICDWLQVLRQLHIDFQLLVINDGSTDDTPRVVAELASAESEVVVINQSNAGHGAAVLHGYQKADARWVFQTDSDGELPASDFPKLWSRKEDVDGVRGLRPGNAGAAYRNVLRRLEPLPVALLFGRWHRDVNIPYRLYRREALQRMLEVLPPAPFAPNALLTALAPGRGLRIRTVDIQYSGRAAGTSKLKWFTLSKACLKVMVDLLRARFRSR